MIIDLSENNGFVDYQKVKNAGVVAAILKTCPGVGKIDSRLVKNALGLADVGIPVSYYHVIHPDKRSGTIESDATDESNWFLKAISGLPKPIRLWADIEDWDSNGTDSPLNKADFQLWMQTYMDNIKRQTGNDAGIYTYKSYFDTHLPADHPFGKYKLWIANYGKVAAPPLPVGFSYYHLWQYDANGQVDGIPTKVDLSKLK